MCREWDRGEFVVSLELRRVSVAFDGTVAVDGVDLSVEDGHVLAVLGPSGCGKSTLLRAVAGLEPLTSGRIAWDGADLAGVPTHRRGFALMFQDGQLFDHLTVARNVGYARRLQGASRAAVRAEVDDLLDLVGLAGYADRLPRTLSGGERQRVALARSLAARPRLLLLDEPLSALDRKLRADLQAELKALHRRTGLTFLHVTHDQEEALSLSTRVAVLSGGRLAQVGTPDAIYDRPATRFVAEFVGGTNILAGPVVARDAREITLDVGGRPIRHALGAGEPPPGAEAVLSLRPEALGVGNDGRDNMLDGVVSDTDYAGSVMRLMVDVPGIGPMRTLSTASVRTTVGQPVRLGWSARDTRLLAG